MKIIKVKTDKVVNNFVDPSTGEILDSEEEVKHHKIVVGDKESFAMMFIPVIGLIDTLDKVSIKVLQWAALNAGHNSNVVHLGKYSCSLIEQEFDIKYQTIKDAISKLKNKNAIIPLGSGAYRVNPRYYWKGQTSERIKTMRYILEIECPDCMSKELKEELMLPENTEFLKEALEHQGE